jgi:hypothetical protein
VDDRGRKVEEVGDGLRRIGCGGQKLEDGDWRMEDWGVRTGVGDGRAESV